MSGVEAMETDTVEDVHVVDADNLPWVEKYRPTSLNELVSHDEVIKTLQKFISSNKIPHMLFYGPPGTGKTSTVLAAARTLYSDKEIKSMVLELNASDDRGINVVRDEIVSFAQTRSLHMMGQDKGVIKMVVLDEADAMTRDAQNALRRVIEKYTDNVRFCIICNYLSSIIPAIQSRCTRFRFAPLNLQQIDSRLQYVIEKENVKITEDGKRALLDLCEGDMRRVLNVLQSSAMAFPLVNEEAVYKCVGQPTPKHIEELLKILLNDSLSSCITKIQNECVKLSYALSDIVSRLHDMVFKLDIPSNITCVLINVLAETEYRLAEGGSDKIQLGGLCAAFVKARRMIAQVGRQNTAT